MSSSRRDILRSTVALAGASAAMALSGNVPTLHAEETNSSPVPLNTAPTEKTGDMFYRTLGKTGEKVSLIGLGGYHIGSPKDPAEGIRIIRSAIDRGINFMDNCWDYHNGDSEVRMGNALRDGYRKKVFLMTKIDSRSKEGCA